MAFNDIFQELKKKCQTRILLTAKLFFQIEGKIKTFNGKQKLKEYITTKTALQKILKGVLY
jgi:hypothetical protein